MYGIFTNNFCERIMVSGDSSVMIFAESYPSYSYWYDAVKKASCVYHITFTDLTSKYKPELLELFNNNTSVKSAITFLQKRGIY